MRLGLAFAVTWEILWALALGFTLLAIVQAVVSKREMTRLPPDDSPRTVDSPAVQVLPHPPARTPL